MKVSYPNLFSPVRIGLQESRNRVMRTATTTNLAENGMPGEAMVEFYRTLAKGGVGTIVTETYRIHKGGGFVPTAVALYDREIIPALKRLVGAVHAHHSLLIAQLYHGGRQHTSRRPETLWAPSAVACPFSGGTPHEMTLGEIEELIDGFVIGAANAIEAGFDGIEIHGGQGHLIQSFMSPFSNRRIDRYGGSDENRMNFAREIVQRVRHRIGPTPILGYRMGIDEFTDGGITIEDSKKVASRLEADGFLDYLSLTQSNFNSIETHLPDRHYEQATYARLQEQIRSHTRLTLIASTRIQTPDQAEKIIASGAADMVGVARALIVDPEWPAKASSGRASEIRRCIACNQCWDGIVEGGPIRCATNATAGRELSLGPLRKDNRRRRVLVVGGGPGGLEAARVAALRGHSVMLLEKETTLGGKVRWACEVPHHEEMSNLVDYLIPQAKKAGVGIRTGETASADRILSENPDLVILSTGATPIVPDLPTDGSVPLLAGRGMIDAANLRGDTLIVMDEDGHFWGAAVAEAAARTGKQVKVVTRFFEAFRELPAVSRIPTLRSLDDQGVDLMPNMAVHRIENGCVVLRHYRSGRERVVPAAAAVIWVGMQRPNDALAVELRARGFRHYRLIGDAYAPRRIPNALLDAQTVARAI